MIVADLAAYLQLKGIGTIDADLFYEYVPPSPDEIAVITSNGGDRTEINLPFDNATIQVRTRSTTVSGAYNKIAAIYNELQGLHSTTLPNGIYVISCQVVQSAPINIGRDAQNRLEYTQDYDLMIRNQTVNRR
jgi:hypothetical protein